MAARSFTVRVLVLVAAVGAVSIQPHISDYEMETNAGFFKFNGLYMGGVPQQQYQIEFYSCTQTNASNGRTFCTKWTTSESGGQQTASGLCVCTKGNVNQTYCQNFYCNQDVTETQTCGDDDNTYTCTSTFSKYKLCSCTAADASGLYCASWFCNGYGDGAVKSNYWFCKTNATTEVSASAANNYCYSFGSNQYSSDVTEAKDCVCLTDAGTYCSQWTCDDRIYTRWPWYNPIIGSLVAAALNLWIPFVSRTVPGAWSFFGGLGWVVLTYLIIVLVGGVLATIANTTALIIAYIVAYRAQLSQCTCCCTKSTPVYAMPFPHETVMGHVMTPAGYPPTAAPSSDNQEQATC